MGVERRISIKLPSSSLSLLLLTSLIQFGQSDFRFCHHGPHRFDFKDCPGGVLFKKPISTECTFFSKNSKIGDGRIQVNGDLCEGKTAEDADVSAATPTHSFALPKIQEIKYDGDLNVGTEGVNDTSQSDCISNCFANWLDLDRVEEISETNTEAPNILDQEVVYNFPKPTPEIEAEQKKITVELFTKLLMAEFEQGSSKRDGGVDPDPRRPNRRIIQLLRDSFAVMTTHCPNIYIPQVFFDKVVKSMVYLLDRANTTIKDIGIKEYGQVLDVLAQCRIFDRHSTFHIISKECQDPARIKGGRFARRNGQPFIYRYKPNRFRMELYDPFIESAWSAVGFVHGMCFRHFTGEFNIHHVYIVAMEAMFNVKNILERWVVAPPKLTSKDYWNNVMGVSDYEVVLQNVHACLKLAYQSEAPVSPYWKILERPFRQLNGTESGPDPEDPTVGRGWEGDEKKYWSHYRRQGGFKRTVKSLGGTCFKSESEREAALTTAQSSCSQSS